MTTIWSVYPYNLFLEYCSLLKNHPISISKQEACREFMVYA
jgi:hypothetical protein